MRQKAALILLILLIAGTFLVRTYRFNHRDQSRRPPGLARIIDEIRFDDTPLESALAELSQRAGVRIDVDWEAIAPLGVNRGVPVRFRLFNVRAEAVLNELLTQSLGAKWGLPGAETLGYSWNESACFVTRASAVPLELRMYNCADLVKQQRSLKGPTMSQIAAPQGWSGEDSHDEDIMSIVKYALSEDGSQIWAGHGRLFVRQDPQNHLRVECVLRNLRRLVETPDTKRPIEGPIDLLAEP
jgi:hypothetical protein